MYQPASATVPYLSAMLNTFFKIQREVLTEIERNRVREGKYRNNEYETE